MKEITKHYLEAALWTATDGNEDPLQDNYSLEDFAPEAIERAELHVSYFIDRAKPWLKAHILSKNYPESQTGHDLWLTRNGHGTGFWDRKELEEGNRGNILTEICEKMGESDCYLGDDGKIYLT